jgi:hypothetical protein
MKRVQNLFKQNEFHLLLFFLGIALFSWPFLKVLHAGDPQTTFCWVFSLWGAAIFLLFVISRSCNDSDSAEISGKNKD